VHANAVVKIPISGCKPFFFWREQFFPFGQPEGLVELAA